MQQPFLGEKTGRRLRFLINFTYWAVWLALLLLGTRTAVRWLMPFVTAFVLASLLQKPLRFLETRFSFSHNFATAAVLVVTLSVIGGVLTLVCWRGGLFLIRFFGKEETLEMLQRLGSDFRHIITLLSEKAAHVLPTEFTDLLVGTAQKLEQTLYQSGAALLTSLSRWLMNFATGSLPGTLLAVVFFLPAAVFFTRDYNNIVRFIHRQIPPPQRPVAVAAKNALKDTFTGAAKAYFLLLPIVFVLLLIGFWLLKVSSPVLLALLAALIDIFPVLGVGTVLIPLGIFRLVAGNIGGGVGVFVLYGGITALRNVLQPKLFSKKIGLPPLITLLSMYAGWKAAGLLGLLFAPILTMVVLRLQKEGFLNIFK